MSLRMLDETCLFERVSSPSVYILSMDPDNWLEIMTEKNNSEKSWGRRLVWLFWLLFCWDGPVVGWLRGWMFDNRWAPHLPQPTTYSSVTTNAHEMNMLLRRFKAFTIWATAGLNRNAQISLTCFVGRLPWWLKLQRCCCALHIMKMYICTGFPPFLCFFVSKVLSSAKVLDWNWIWERWQCC